MRGRRLGCTIARLPIPQLWYTGGCTAAGRTGKSAQPGLQLLKRVQRGVLCAAGWAAAEPAADVTVAVSGSMQKGQLPSAAGAAVCGQANELGDLHDRAETAGSPPLRLWQST